MVRPLEILVALVKRQTGQGYSNSGRFFGRPSMSPFLAIRFIRVIGRDQNVDESVEREFVLKFHRKLGQQDSCLCED